MSNKFLTIIVPGLLIAATGVGAGDLATAAFAGGHLGVAILWAVVLGGLFKFALTEGIARWQLVNGESFIDGLSKRLDQPFVWVFLIYLVLWSFFVGSALISANGVAMHSLLPVFDPEVGKVVFGITLSVIGLLVVRIGNFALFEKVMSISIGIMFMVVITTAILLWPGTEAFLKGLFIPSIPNLDSNGLAWTVALVGGVGGTLTIFSYGYWIHEKQRHSVEDIKTCRLDLAFGYSATVIFGMAMVIIGSTVPVDGKGTGLLLNLANGLEQELGDSGRWLFLVGAFFAVFSSLLGVWQAVPYMFADVVRHLDRKNKNSQVLSKQETLPKLSQAQSYKWFQLALAILPMLSLCVSFQEVQKLYAIVGTFFMPFLAMALLYFNNQKGMQTNKSGVFINLLLWVTLVFFSYVAWQKLS